MSRKYSARSPGRPTLPLFLPRSARIWKPIASPESQGFATTARTQEDRERYVNHEIIPLVVGLSRGGMA
jgi:hypothetical protein